jgi:hypothetical protein
MCPLPDGLRRATIVPSQMLEWTMRGGCDGIPKCLSYGAETVLRTGTMIAMHLAKASRTAIRSSFASARVTRKMSHFDNQKDVWYHRNRLAVQKTIVSDRKTPFQPVRHLLVSGQATCVARSDVSGCLYVFRDLVASDPIVREGTDP